MVKNAEINHNQIEEILLSFQKESSRYPTFEEFCSHGKKLLPSALPSPISPVQKEKLRQKVKYIVAKQKKMLVSVEKIERNKITKDSIEKIERNKITKDSIEKIERNKITKDSVSHFKEVALYSSIEVLNQKKAIAILHQIILKEAMHLAKSMIARKNFDKTFSIAFDVKLCKLLELRKLL